MNWPKAKLCGYAILGVYRLRLMNLSCVVIRRREKLVHIVVGIMTILASLLVKTSLATSAVCTAAARSSSGFFALRGNVSFAKDSSKGVIRKPHAVPLQP